MAPAHIRSSPALLFSIAAGAGALGHHYCAAMLQRQTPPRLIAAAAGRSGGRALGSTSWCMSAGGCSLATPIFGIAIGVGMTAAYTAAATVIPAGARGAGFGLLTTASLVGLAVSPIVSGLLGATSIRAVFALDVVALGALAVVVIRTADARRSGLADVAAGGQHADEEPVVSETL